MTTTAWMLAARPDEGPDPAVVVGVLGALLGVMIVIAFLVRVIARRMSLPCYNCSNVRLSLWAELDRDTQEAILSYFRDREHRQPDVDRIFVCRECKAVYDDFAGEGRSREADWLYKQGLCKVCNHIMAYTAIGSEGMRCRVCGTTYQWALHEPSGYYFLTPPPDAEVLSKPWDAITG